MFRFKKSDTITTFLGSDASIDGVIEFKGTIRLDGKVKGKISSDDGTLIVGEKAIIDADIQVDTAIIMGQVKGIIEARSRIEVYPPGSVLGDIQAPAISIDAGVKFNGNCAMKSPRLPIEMKPESRKAVLNAEDTKIKTFPKNL